MFSYRMVFSYLVITGWIFDISLFCENSINQSVNYTSLINSTLSYRGGIHLLHIIGLHLSRCGYTKIREQHKLQSIYLKKNMNACKSYEHPPSQGEEIYIVKRFRWGHRMQEQKLCMGFTWVPQW